MELVARCNIACRSSIRSLDHRAARGSARRGLQQSRDQGPGGRAVPRPRGFLEAIRPTHGRTRGDEIVVFPGDDSMIGETVNIEVTSATALTLHGELASHAQPSAAGAIPLTVIA